MLICMTEMFNKFNRLLKLRELKEKKGDLKIHHFEKIAYFN